MKALIAIAVVGLVLGGCSPNSGPETVAAYSASVYDIEEPSSDDPLALQLGLHLESCSGDYEVEVQEASGTLTVTAFDHSPTREECTDFTGVHLDAPPHGKTVVDTSTGDVLEVSVEPLP